TCPECAATFCPGHEAPPTPALDLREIKAQRERLRKWEVEVPEYSMPEPLHSKTFCADARKAFDQLPLIQQWEEERSAIKKSLGKDVSVEIDQLKEIRRQWTSYDERLTDYTRRVDQVETAKEALAALEVVEGDEDALSTAVVEARVYEGASSA